MAKTDLRRLEGRNRALFLACREVGDRRYDPKEHLLTQHLAPFPHFCGHTVGQCSLEYAIALLETSTEKTAAHDARLASQIISRCTEFQDTDPSSPTFGNFRWMTDWTEVRDRNAVSFMMPSLGYLWLRHRDRLTAVCRRRLLRAMKLARNGLRLHRVPWQYTNIRLLNIQSALLLGNILDDDSMTRLALEDWQAWWVGTQREGLHEYNSPTYVPVSAAAMMGIWEQCRDPSVKRQAGQALEVVLRDFAENYHAPTGYLTGAMSRAYPHDYLTGDSLAAALAFHQFGTLLRMAEWEGTLPAIFAEHRYVAPRAIRELALCKRYPLTVSRQVRDLGVTTINFLTESYAVGSQSGGSPVAVPLFVAYAGSGSRRTVAFVNDPVFQGELGLYLTSQQEGNKVVGSFHRTLSENERGLLAERPDLAAGIVAFLGTLSDMTATLGGTRWNGQVSHLRNGERLVLDFGHVQVSLTFRFCSHGGGSDTAWKQNAARLEVCDSEAVLRLKLYDAVWAKSELRGQSQIGFELTVKGA